MPVKDTPFKESPFGAPKQSLWGESSSPRFVSSRQAPTTSHTQSTQRTYTAPSSPRTYTTPSTPKKTIVSANAESLGRGETSRRLVSANTAGGATRVAQLTPGQFIEHERFGIGEVLKVEGTGENTKAHIRFKNAGEKQLLLKFARFRVLG